MKPLDYWKQDERREDQYFYVAFALVGSAVNDFGVANDLHLSGKLNWAASAYYYSMVHAGRLAVFLAYGDFPQGHKQLAQTFGEQGMEGGRFWFSSLRGTMASDVEASVSRDFNRPKLARRYKERGMEAADAQRTFGQFAQILERAKRLREDSNYESLLIAHAIDHVVVTRAFERQCETLRGVAARVLRDAIRLWQVVINEAERGPKWLAFLNGARTGRGLLYIEEFVSRVVQRPEARTEALSILKPLRSETCSSARSSDEVYDNIKMRVFPEKANKMRDFDTHIRNLSEVAREME